MKAVVMVGGKGTRLRPLTCNLPKPMVPLANRPMMEHVVSLLGNHGVDEHLVTLCYLPEAIENHFGDGSQFGVSMKYFREEKPLGTGGSVKNVSEHLDGTFLVTAGDVLTDIDLSAAIANHKKNGAMATIVLTRVDNPLEYGVVITNPDGRIRRFLEKPSWGEVFSDTVNTCIYILEPECLDYFDKDQVFDFSKDLFPLMLEKGDPLFGYIADGYWSDIGNLDQYRQSHYDVLEGKVALEIAGMRIGEKIWIGEGCDIHPDAVIEGPAIIGSDCCVGPGAIVGEYSIIGDKTIIGSRSSIKRSVVWTSAHIGNGAQVRGATVCNKCTVRESASLYEGSVLGAGSSIGEGSVLKQSVKVWPGKSIDAGTTLNESLIWAPRSNRRIFGSAGVIGLINVDLTPEFAAKLATAYGSEVAKHGPVTVSNDQTKASRMLKRAVVSGLMAAGTDVYDLGTLTTSVARYAARSLKVSGGIHMRTNQVNKETVVMEFLDNQGLNIDKSTERKIENAYFTEDFARAPVEKIGEPSFLPRLVDSYLQGLLGALELETIRKQKYRVAVNYNPGCLSLLVPSLLDNLGCRVIAEMDNQEIDPLVDLAQNGKTDLGVMVDGNAETLVLVDEKGMVLSDDQFDALMTLIKLRISHDKTIAVPVTASKAALNIAEQNDGKVVWTQSNVRAQMEKAIAHLQADAPAPVFDALVSLSRVIEYLALEQITLSQAVASLPETHMNRRSVPCSWEAKGRVMRTLIEEFASDEGTIELLDGVKIHKDDGWALVLPDPDKPLCHVVSEAMSDDEAEKLSLVYADRISQLQSVDGLAPESSAVQ